MNSKNKKILITGAGGFIGEAFLKFFSGKGLHLTAVVHHKDAINRLEEIADMVILDSLEDEAKVCEIFRDQDVIIHLAARVHRMKENFKGSKILYKSINRDMTARVANACLKESVPKLVFASSVAIFGNSGVGFLDDATKPNPATEYGLSKLEAEKELEKIFNGNATIECLVLRLPMVYGPGNKGNFLRFLNIAARGYPLPLGLAKGKRSMLYIGNLCDSILKIVMDDRKGRETVKNYFLNDGEDLTSSELYKMVSRIYNDKEAVFPFPEVLLRFGGQVGTALEKLFGRKLPFTASTVSSLFDECYFSSKQFCEYYNWQQPYGVEEAVTETVKWHKSLAKEV